MHELGIVTYVAKTATRIAEENEIQKVKKVILEIGEVSGIVPEYLIDCWDYFKKRYPPLTQSGLECETVRAVTYCENCKKEYETVAHGKICPYCESEKTYLLIGKECNIKELVI